MYQEEFNQTSNMLFGETFTWLSLV